MYTRTNGSSGSVISLKSIAWHFEKGYGTKKIDIVFVDLENELIDRFQKKNISLEKENLDGHLCFVYNKDSFVQAINWLGEKNSDDGKFWRTFKQNTMYKHILKRITLQNNKSRIIFWLSFKEEDKEVWRGREVNFPCLVNLETTRKRGRPKKNDMSKKELAQKKQRVENNLRQDNVQIVIPEISINERITEIESPIICSPTTDCSSKKPFTEFELPSTVEKSNDIPCTPVEKPHETPSIQIPTPTEKSSTLVDNTCEIQDTQMKDVQCCTPIEKTHETPSSPIEKSYDIPCTPIQFQIPSTPIQKQYDIPSTPIDNRCEIEDSQMNDTVQSSFSQGDSPIRMEFCPEKESIPIVDKTKQMFQDIKKKLNIGSQVDRIINSMNNLNDYTKRVTNIMFEKIEWSKCYAYMAKEEESIKVFAIIKPNNKLFSSIDYAFDFQSIIDEQISKKPEKLSVKDFYLVEYYHGKKALSSIECFYHSLSYGSNRGYLLIHKDKIKPAIESLCQLSNYLIQFQFFNQEQKLIDIHEYLEGDDKLFIDNRRTSISPLTIYRKDMCFCLLKYMLKSQSQNQWLDTLVKSDKSLNTYNKQLSLDKKSVIDLC